MIDLRVQSGQRCKMLEPGDPLPDLRGARELYLDVETTSGDPKLKAISPWHGDEIAGIAVTHDDNPDAYYIPIRHWDYEHRCLPIEQVHRWLKETVGANNDWVNHNVKFDAHFCTNEGAEFGGRLVDTMTLAKLIDSDRGYGGKGYGLKDLSEDWLDMDLREEQLLHAWLEAAKTKDFGDTPPDLLGRYACMDVQMNRLLWKYMCKRRPSEVKEVWDNEILLTPVLYDIENEGLRVDETELVAKEITTLQRMVQLEEWMHNHVGRMFSPGTPDSIADVIMNHFGLPAVEYTKGSIEKAEEEGDDSLLNPSFNKDALAAYQRLPEVMSDDSMYEFFDKLLSWRKLNTLLGFFVRPYQELNIDGILHPTYNQSVRTGRMSSKNPNAQQLSPEAKELVHPVDSECFLRFDYSQIEFRLICHYIRDEKAIRAYAENPDTDFHQFVADLCGIPRKPAKNVNFAIAYGGGRHKVLTMLAGEPALVKDLSHVVDEEIAAGKIRPSQKARRFQSLCERRARKVYNTYHRTFPGIKATSDRAVALAEGRGWVKNAYGRRRHLPIMFAYRAFNSIIQSCAADVMKAKLVQIAPRYNSMIRDLGIRVAACVHDEFLFACSRDVGESNEVRQYIRDTLELHGEENRFRVPITVEGGYATSTWREASSDDAVFHLPRAA